MLVDITTLSSRRYHDAIMITDSDAYVLVLPQVLRTSKSKPAAGPDDPGFGTDSVRDAVGRVVDIIDPTDKAQLRARLTELANDPQARIEARARGELGVLASAVDDLVAQITAAKAGNDAKTRTSDVGPAERAALAGEDGARLEEKAIAVRDSIAAALGRPEELSIAVKDSLVTDAVGRLDELDLVMDR